MSNGAFKKPPPTAESTHDVPSLQFKEGEPASVPLYEIGTTGVRISGGVIYESRLQNFKGSQRATVIREMAETDATVAGLLSNFTMLGRNVEYSIETEGKSAEEKKAVEHVEQCLEDMENSFEDYMTSFFSVLPFGFTFHELNWKMRQGEEPGPATILDESKKEIQIDQPPSKFDDGLYGWAGWPIRKQDSISRWKLTPNGRVKGAYQRVDGYGGRAGERLIPIEKAIHVTTNSADGNPEGRALDPETSIPTPDGWRVLDQLQPGDKVFDESGRIRYVVARADWEDRPCYCITFSDGSEVVADANHTWVTKTQAERRRGKPARERTTEEIAKSLKNSQGISNHSIEWAEALDYPEQVLPVDPWMLGYWLGNGNSNSSEIYCHAQDVHELTEAVASSGFVAGDAVLNGSDPAGNGRKIRVFGADEKNSSTLSRQLAAIGLLKNKHIPAAYLRGSATQRLQLLCGLMDSDGHVDAYGRCEFCNTNQGLALNVAELVRSLGVAASVTSKQKQPHIDGSGRTIAPRSAAYLVKFTPTFIPFRLSRKAARCKPGRARANHYIVNAESVEPRRTVCIEVDSPSGLFLAGTSMVPTHNSILEACYRAWFSKRNFEDLVGIGVKRDLVGYPVMSFPKDANIWLEANAAKLFRAETLVANLFRDEYEGLVKPEDVKLELLASPGAPRYNIRELMDWLRLEIAIGTLTEFALVGHEGSGSLALKREATRVFMLALDGILKKIAAAINDQAIRPLMKMNQWKLKNNPTLKFGTVDVPAVEAIIDSLGKLATAGATVFPDPELQKHIYTKLQVPIPSDEDLARMPQDLMPGAEPGAEPEPEKEEPEPEPEEEPEEEEEPKPKKKPAAKKAASEEEEQKQQGFFARTFGGPGSGHHGHQGRPGEVGGSLPGEGGGSSESKLGQISLETTPGHSARILEGIHSASYEERTSFMREVMTAVNSEELLGELGLGGTTFEVVGVWNGEQNPGIQIQIGKTNDSPEVLRTKVEAFSAAMGKALYQEGVGYHIPKYNGDPAQDNIAEVNIGRTFDREQMSRVYSELKREIPGLDDEMALIGSRNGVRVLNWAGKTTNGDFHQKLLRAAERADVGDFTLDTFAVDSDVITNNWKVNSNGQGYDSKIAAGGSRFQGRANRVYDRARTVYEKYASKWGRAKAAAEAKKVARYVAALFAKAFGGPGSGHFGHAGRPGEVGGSAPGEGGAPTWALSPGGNGSIEERNPKNTTSESRRAALESTNSSIHSKLSQIGAVGRELTPVELKRVTELVAGHLESNPDMEAALKALNVDEKRVTLNAEDRYTLSLHESSHLSVYLLRWGPGQQAEWHDHGDGDRGAKVSIRVLDGPVENDFLNSQGQIVKQELEEGKTYWLPAPYLHRMGDWAEGRGAGWSVHSYSGPEGGLAKMTWYKFDEDNDIVLDDAGKPIPVGTWEREPSSAPKESPPPAAGSEEVPFEGVYEIDDDGNLKPVVGKVVGRAKRFHTPGGVEHDQKSHGNWATGADVDDAQATLPGMIPPIKTPQPAVRPYNHWVPKRGYDDDSFVTVAEALRDEPLERGVAWDKDGKMVASFSSENYGSVEVPPEILNSLPGGTMLHNHPHEDWDSATAFSEGDLVSSISNSVARSIVATRVRGEPLTFTADFSDPEAIRGRVSPEGIGQYMYVGLNSVWPAVNAAAGSGVFGELEPHDNLPWTVATHIVNMNLARDVGYMYNAHWTGRIGPVQYGTLDDAALLVADWAKREIGGRAAFRRERQLTLPERPMMPEPAPFSEDEKFEKAKRRWLEEGPRKKGGGKFGWKAPKNPKKLEPPKMFGGPGSGHHGHAGRPGEIGGSLPGEGAPSAADAIPADIRAERERRIEKAAASRGTAPEPYAPPGSEVLDSPGYSGLSLPQAQMLHRYEHNIKNQTTETAIVVAASGETRVNKNGTNSAVIFDDKELSQMAEGVFTHNHPSGHVFSDDDLTLASHVNAAEIRVVTPLGDTFRMTRAGKEWPDIDDIRREYWDVERSIAKERAAKIRERVEANPKSRDTNAEFFNPVTTEEARQLGVDHMKRFTERFEKHPLRFHGTYNGKPI